LNETPEVSVTRTSSRGLLDHLENLEILDHHAHNVLRWEIACQHPLRWSFTEASDPREIADHTENTLFYRRSLKDLAEVLGCEPDTRSIEHRRATLGLDALTALSVKSAKLGGVLLDDGLSPGTTMPTEWHARRLPVARLVRMERIVEDLLATKRTFVGLRDGFRAALEAGPHIAGYKTIAAYRSGLQIEKVSPHDLQRKFDDPSFRKVAQGRRLTDKEFVDFFIYETMDVARCHKKPLQFHTGFGDPDLDLRLSNPLHLRPLLEDPRYREVPVILLHASYPFCREAAYLASIYPQVYVDFGLAIPFLSIFGMRQTLRTLLELAPTSKLLYSSDASRIPDLYYLGARWGRRIVADVLEESVKDGDLTAREAERAANLILRDTAKKLYGLHADSPASESSAGCYLVS
jgi:predicted TIM-barrel fold metal-dependent hydrolase